MKKRLGTALVGIACQLLGCSVAPEGPAPEDLSAARGPVYIWQRALHGDPAKWGRVIAIDGDGQGWYYLGVDNATVTLHPWRPLSAAEVSNVGIAFSELPGKPTACEDVAGAEDEEGFVVSFSRRTTAGETTWIGCTTAYDGHLVLARPYSDVDGALASIGFP